MSVDIVIIISRNFFLVSELIDSICKSNKNNKFKIKLFLVFNGITSSNFKIKATWQHNNFHIENIQNHIAPSTARNIALKYVSSSYVLFLDDDVSLPMEYFNVANKIINTNQQLILGGPDRMYPSSSLIQNIFSLAIESIDVTFHTISRHQKIHKSNTIAGHEYNLILCNLWMHSDIFLKHNFRFNEQLWRNEENVLLAQIAKLTKYNILYCGDLFVFHHRKKNLMSIFKAYFNSGKYRVKTINYIKLPYGILYYLPIAISVLIILLLISQQFYIILNLFLIYTLINLVSSFRKVGLKIYLIPILFFMKIFILLSYTLGQLSSTAKSIFYFFKSKINFINR